MKYYEYKIDSDKIEFSNSFIGKETVKVNGKKISEKFSITGTVHLFKVNSNEILLKTNYDLFKDRKFDLNLFREGQLIDSERIELNPKYRVYMIGIGVFIGYWMIKIYNRI